MSNKLTVAYIKLSLSILLWGGVYQVGKIAISQLDVYTLAFVRYFLASIGFCIILKINNGKLVHKLNKNQLHALLVTGFFGVFLYNIVFFTAERLIAPNVVAMLFSFTPCISMMLAYLFLKTSVRPRALIGILIALLGTIGVINYSNTQCGQFFCANMFVDMSWGQIFAILCSLFMAIFNISGRNACQLKIPPMVITTYSSLIGCFFLLILFLIFGDWTTLKHISDDGIFSLFYLAVFGTVLPYIWYTEALNTIGVSKTSIFQNGVPISSVLLGFIFFDQSISLAVLVSGIVVILGVLFTNLTMTK